MLSTEEAIKEVQAYQKGWFSKRESTENFVELDINELYEYFTEETTYNTQTARKHITGYAYSPAAAIINALVKSE